MQLTWREMAVVAAILLGPPVLRLLICSLRALGSGAAQSTTSMCWRRARRIVLLGTVWVIAMLTGVVHPQAPTDSAYFGAQAGRAGQG